MKPYSDRQTVTFDINHTLEFTGDDADQFSDLIDLGNVYTHLLIEVPASALTSTQLNLYIQNDSKASTVPVLFHNSYMKDSTGTGTFTTEVWATTASTGNYIVLVPVGYIQYFRLRATTNQTTADKTIYARGVNL